MSSTRRKRQGNAPLLTQHPVMPNGTVIVIYVFDQRTGCEERGECGGRGGPGGVDAVTRAHPYPMNETSRRLQLFQFQQNNMLLKRVEISISTVFRHRIAVKVGPGGLQVR